MQYFQPILIVIGILAIAAVLIHGYLLNRKNQVSEVFPDSGSNTDDIFAEKKAACDLDDTVDDVHIMQANHDSDDGEENDFFTTLDADRMEEVDFVSEFSTNEHCEDVNLQEDQDDLRQPTIVAVEEQKGAQLENNKQAEQYPVQETQDIFIFNVVAREEAAVVRGHELLQFFLTAGFRFGEMSIFHRHLHSDGTGPILFSIANMMAPGVFDPENMEQFRSQGVSFFLTVPNDHINVKEAFDMMLVAVEQMAEEFDCLVLNAEREPLTEQQFRNYHERLLRYI